MKKYIILISSVILLVSCEKEISINLNKTNPRIVIEGNVSNLKGECSVKITKTINFDETIPNPTVSGALVTIINMNTNKIDTLNETKPGIYTNDSLQGISGQTYTLIVKTNNETYIASSTIPKMVNLESIQLPDSIAGETSHGGPFGGGTGSNTIIRMIPIYIDPVEVANFFQFVVTKNDTMQKDIFIQSDFGFNGLVSNRPLRVKANKNDIVKVDLQCIDEAVYNYLFGLNENIHQSSATPANPVSNISNNALGYFKAHTSSIKTIKIK
ncbi:MAG: DUF4249 family protein [Bacteroidetes bacterium]|nr:DUF4249 family protein [Bacteroidota bacterium]